MSAVDGGDGSVLVEGDPAVQSQQADSGSDAHSQVSSSTSRDHDECDQPEDNRKPSNSTTGRWCSSASWGERDYSWGDDRHWGAQWRDDGWRSRRSWWGNEDTWNSAWDDYGENENDENMDWSWDPWAEAAWGRDRRDSDGRRSGDSGGRERRGSSDSRREDRAPMADGRDRRQPGNDPPGRQEARKPVWSGWRHYAPSDRSDGGSHDGEERKPSGNSRPSEKLTVPSFSGEDSEDVGSSARSYLRQVEAWRRMTLLPITQQGLVLYQHLSGKAWVAAEELNVDKLAGEDGVQYLVGWITNRYLDLEVTRIGKAFSEFFRKLRRKPGQSIRDYNSEYDRLHARLREVGCSLPEDCAAWLYVDRLQLEEAAELNLLASVGNAYSLGKLQQAAVIHDRGHRKPWEGNSGKGRRPHTAHFTEADDYLASGDEDMDNENDSDEGIPEEVAVAYATYQSAKQKYKEHQKSRGFQQVSDSRPEQPPANKANEKTSEKIRLMKAKSFCSGCGRRGHWHKDAECPHNQGGQQRGHEKNFGKAAEVGFCNLLPAEVFSIKHEEANLLGITDTACARTVAGTQWLQAYTDKQAALGFRPELRKECEAYRFGTGKIHYSSFYVVLAFELGNKIVQVRTSIINGDVPLLLSKTVLGKLGMVFDIEKGQADFNKVGLRGFDLLVTASGHPAIPIVPTRMDGDSTMFQAEDLKLVPKSQYMAYAVAHGSRCSRSPDMYNFFYDKKLDPGIKAMLVQEKLPQEEFVTLVEQYYSYFRFLARM